MALHIEGTVIHDACHKAAHPVPWINQAMGHGSAILLGFSFPVFTRVHLQHHIHVNHPKNDPDHIVSTFGPIWLIAPRFFYHEVFFFQRKLWRRYELLQWGIERSIFITIILAGLKFDFMNLIYNLWFGPALMVGVTLGIFFDYLPHRPFRSRNKWINSRVYPSKFMNLLIMGQNYHLIHHLWPSIPWFEFLGLPLVMLALLTAGIERFLKSIWQTPGEHKDSRRDPLLWLPLSGHQERVQRSQGHGSRVSRLGV